MFAWMIEKKNKITSESIDCTSFVKEIEYFKAYLCGFDFTNWHLVVKNLVQHLHNALCLKKHVHFIDHLLFTFL